MKKKITISIIILLIIGIAIGFFIQENKKTDAKKFKEEYEIYNDISYKKNNKNMKYLKLDIKKDNPIIYLTDENVIKEMKTGNKIIYFGSPDNNECRNAVKVLLKVAKDNGIETIYYYKINKNKNNEVNKNIESEINKYKEKQKLSIPTVIMIKDGKIKLYDNESSNKKEYKKLYKTYEDMMIELLMCAPEDKGC